MLKRHAQLMLSLLYLGDVAVAALAWGVGYGLRHVGGQMGLTHFATPPFSQFLPLMILSLLLTGLVFGRFDLYAPKRTMSLSVELRDVLKSVAVIWALVYFASSVLQAFVVSRLMMGSVLLSWVSLAILFRVSARESLHAIRMRGWNLRHAAIVGTGRLAQHLCHLLRKTSWMGIRPAYFVDSNREQQSLWGLRVYQPCEMVDVIIAVKPVDIVFVALPRSRHAEMEQILERLAETDVDIQVVPDLLSHILLNQDVSPLEDLCLVSLTSSPQHQWHSVLKRAMDVSGALLGLILLAVPMAVIALVIKCTSSGPIFYRQARTSLDYTRFNLIKFRTMIEDAEKDLGPVWSSQNDPRITKVGRFLRRASLDELPQLFNVLLGHMSLVGPRPERPELVERFRRQFSRYMLRHHAKPGLTGLAQVRGYRGLTSLRKRIQYDLYYASNWSLGLDLWIILLTVLGGFIDQSQSSPRKAWPAIRRPRFQKLR